MRPTPPSATDLPGFGTAALLPTLGAAHRASLARGLSVALALSASGMALVYGPDAVRIAREGASTSDRPAAAAVPYGGRRTQPVPR